MTLQIIRDKCESIEGKIQSLQATIAAFSAVDYRSADSSSSSNEFSTQHLREQFRNLVSPEENFNSNELLGVVTPSSVENLMNYSCIDELLAVTHDISSLIATSRATYQKEKQKSEPRPIKASNVHTVIEATYRITIRNKKPPF